MPQAKHHQESQGSKKTTAAHYHWWQQRPLGGPKKWRVMKPFKRSQMIFKYKLKSNANKIQKFPWKWGVLGTERQVWESAEVRSTSVFWHSRTGGSGRGDPYSLQIHVDDVCLTWISWNVQDWQPVRGLYVQQMEEDEGEAGGLRSVTAPWKH